MTKNAMLLTHALRLFIMGYTTRFMRLAPTMPRDIFDAINELRDDLLRLTDKLTDHHNQSFEGLGPNIDELKELLSKGGRDEPHR